MKSPRTSKQLKTTACVGSSRVAAAEEDAAKSVTEVAVARGVDDRIQRGVGVAGPEQRGHHGVRRIPTSGTQRPGEVPGESIHGKTAIWNEAQIYEDRTDKLYGS